MGLEHPRQWVHGCIIEKMSILHNISTNQPRSVSPLSLSLSLSHSLSFSHLRTKSFSHAFSLSQSFQGRTLRSHRRSPLPPWFSFIPHCKYLLSHLPLFNIVLFICFPLILATAKPQQSQPPVMVVVYSNGLLPLFFYFLLGLGFGFSLFN